MAQLDWLVQPPPGSAFQIAIDGTLRLRFDSSQADPMAQWARDWVRTFERYTAMRSPQATANMGPMPKTLEEIHAFVAKLNAANKEAISAYPKLEANSNYGKEETAPVIMTTPKPDDTTPPVITGASDQWMPTMFPQSPKEPALTQCPKCLGVLNEPDEPTCSVCKGAGYVNAR